MMRSLSTSSRVSRINAIVVTTAITLHWVPNYWSHHVGALFAGIGPTWEYYLSLVLLSLVLTIWAPRSFGLGLGRTIRAWRTIMAYAVVMIVPAVATMVMVKVPFYGQSAATYLCVPFFEELLFRGFLFGVIAAVYPRAWQLWRLRISTASLLTGLSFGLWHLGGLRLPEHGFYWFQVVYASIAGLLMGMLRERTHSVWAGWAIHFLVDWWAVTVPGIWDSS